MRQQLRAVGITLAAGVFSSVAAVASSAQTAAPAPERTAVTHAPPGLMGDLLRDVQGVQEKLLGLAKAMPDSAFAWRPAEGVRSTAEVFQHIAADNYFLPALLDKAPPSETGITKDFKTAVAFEKKPLDKAAVMAELEKSFAFLRSSMTGTTDAQLNAPVEFFGQKNTGRGVWLLTANHLHEHLGQLIAYARMNKVTPPWSK